MKEEQNGIDNKYEVYFTVKGLEYYKYRIMFMRYGAISYPVTIVLNEDIAEEYIGKAQYEYEIGSMAELEAMVDGVFNTHSDTQKGTQASICFPIDIPKRLQGKHILPEFPLSVNR